MANSFFIDAVTQPRSAEGLNIDAHGVEPGARHREHLVRHDLVGLAMNQQHRRPTNDFIRQFLRRNQCAGIA